MSVCFARDSQGPDESDLVGNLCVARKELADLDTGDIGPSEVSILKQFLLLVAIAPVWV